ncbi:MAG: DUF5683 domain-containing protein [Mucilaginibacter sp.]
MYKCFLIVFLFCIISVAVIAQSPDSLAKKSIAEKKLQARLDSVKEHPIVPKVKEKVWHPDSNHSPHKAVMHSLMIPGWGQLYNHQVWKVPLIYAGLGAATYLYIINHNYYKSELAIAKFYQSGTPPLSTDPNYNQYTLYQQYNVTADQVNSNVAYYRRNEEVSIFGFIAGWGIQMIDAYIDAKFQHSYTMDNNLTMKVSPSFINQPTFAGNFNPSYIPGLKLTFTTR